MWNEHFDELLRSFVGEVECFGGQRLDPDRLRRHTLLYAAVMGVAWLLDVPALIRARFGAAAPGSRMDPRIRDDESVRAPLQMLPTRGSACRKRERRQSGTAGRLGRLWAGDLRNPLCHFSFSGHSAAILVGARS
jgi:hypothetical protein